MAPITGIRSGGMLSLKVKIYEAPPLSISGLEHCISHLSPATIELQSAGIIIINLKRDSY